MMSFEYDDEGLITGRGLAIGFGVGAVALGGILVANAAGWVHLDFRLRTNRTLFALPLVTAICLPLIYSTTRRVVAQLASPRRRYRCSNRSRSDVDSLDTGSPTEPVEWTDEDFIPRDEPDPIEALRQYIRQRLHQGATQREVEDELTAGGLDPTSAIDMVSSVRTTGRYGELEVGTDVFVNGIPAGFFRNPVFEKKRRLARRQQRQEREARGEEADPNPELRFDGPATPDK